MFKDLHCLDPAQNLNTSLLCRYLVLLSKWGYLGVKCPPVCFCGELFPFPFQRWEARLVKTTCLLNCLTFRTLLNEDVMWRLGQWLWFSDESASAGGEQPRNVRKGSPPKGSVIKLGLSTQWWDPPSKVWHTNINDWQSPKTLTGLMGFLPFWRTKTQWQKDKDAER